MKGMEKIGKGRGGNGHRRISTTVTAVWKWRAEAQTGRFQGRNAEQISQTLACALGPTWQGQGTTRNSCLIPKPCINTLFHFEKHNLGPEK